MVFKNNSISENNKNTYEITDKIFILGFRMKPCISMESNHYLTGSVHI